MKYNDSNTPLQCFMTQSTCYKGTGKMEVKGVLWHSTGANNPTLKRYVQPDDNAANRDSLISLIGKNTYGNDWNHIVRQAGLNCWIGKLADGTITTVQTMPWDYRPWGCGSGSKGSCNNGWIQFEICEDGLTDASYFKKVYDEACEITAYLCKMFGINPTGTVTMNGVKVPTILCHADSCSLGLGSNHGDVNHWFPKHGKSMATARTDVAALLKGTTVVRPPIVTPPAVVSDPAKTIWNFLTKKGLNAFAVAGVMGNLYAESALSSTNLQNTYEKSLGFTDLAYTTAVDNGSYTNFVKDSAGYGLAQWTYWSRKQALLTYAQSVKKSIGDLSMQLEFLWKELQGYTSVMNTLKTATSVKVASDAILTGFERPADQSDTAKTRRAGFGQTYYNKYASATPTTGKKTMYRVRKTWTDAKSQIGAYTVLENAKKKADANPGYEVYDESGNVVYAGKTANNTTVFTPYLVRVTTAALNIRKQPTTASAVTGTIRGKGVYTIVEEASGAGAARWGKLKSGAGWISLDYTKKV